MWLEQLNSSFARTTTVRASEYDTIDHVAVDQCGVVVDITTNSRTTSRPSVRISPRSTSNISVAGSGTAPAERQDHWFPSAVDRRISRWRYRHDGRGSVPRSPSRPVRTWLESMSSDDREALRSVQSPTSVACSMRPRSTTAPMWKSTPAQRRTTPAAECQRAACDDSGVAVVAVARSRINNTMLTLEAEQTRTDAERRTLSARSGPSPGTRHDVTSVHSMVEQQLATPRQQALRSTAGRVDVAAHRHDR